MQSEDHAARRRMQSESDAAHRRTHGDIHGTTSANDAAHWRSTTRLMLTHLALWVFFGYIVHMFVKPLNNIIIPVLGFPLGFYMAAQGSLIAFVVMLFIFAKQQDNIDREHGVAEED
jgi:putative solute:sodium symporter small subunit